MSDILHRVREACARVAASARFVKIDEPQLGALAARLAVAPPPDDDLDPAHRPFDDVDATVAFVLTLGAVNFGSGWFPKLAKRPGLSGYYTLATALRESFDARGPWSAHELRDLHPGDCARVFGQEGQPGVAELMKLFATALSDLGDFLLERHAGRFVAPVESAAGSAARLVQGLAEMVLFRDVAEYAGLAVPLYKRAQLTVADLAGALGGEGLGRFHDLDRLTLFADNLVPHVLRCEGALVYAPALAERIEAGELIPRGSPEEVEIRAVAVHAVEMLVAAVRSEGRATTARELDFLLWNRGQRPDFKARPRHRTRTTAY